MTSPARAPDRPSPATHREPPAPLAELLRRFDLDPDHPASCHAEAAGWLASPGLDDPSLTDLEALPFVTIDNDDSLDLDQALYIEPRAGGEHTVWYALADAAFYVRPGSALFEESVRRGASYYLPGLVVPMLPLSLSEGLISLNEAVARRALVFRVALDATGEVSRVELLRARVRSRKKLSYRGVQRYWDGLEPMPDADYSASLLALRIVGAQRIRLAEARDVIRYQRIEVDVGLSPDAGFVAFEARRYETDRCNEQISLLVNVEGARFLAAETASSGDGDGGIHAVFRVHPAPVPEHLASFARMTLAVARAHSEPAVAWHPDDETLAHWLDRIAGLASARRGIVLALQRQALIVNQRSTFSAEPGLHYGVGAPCYARFTSPMREVVGIFTHKEALESLALTAPSDDDDTLRTAIIDSANRAKELQRQLTKAANLIVIATMLDADLAQAEDTRPRRVGTIVGLTSDKAYVVVDDPPLEFKVYARDLGTRWHIGPDDAVLTVEREGRPSLVMRLGDRVSLLTKGYDGARDRFAIELATL